MHSLLRAKAFILVGILLSRAMSLIRNSTLSTMASPSPMEMSPVMEKPTFALPVVLGDGDAAAGAVESFVTALLLRGGLSWSRTRPTSTMQTSLQLSCSLLSISLLPPELSPAELERFWVGAPSS